MKDERGRCRLFLQFKNCNCRDKSSKATHNFSDLVEAMKSEGVEIVSSSRIPNMANRVVTITEALMERKVKPECAKLFDKLHEDRLAAYTNTKDKIMTKLHAIIADEKAAPDRDAAGVTPREASPQQRGRQPAR